jgi:nucleotide-binding universal stress UspA family protein
MYQKILVAVDSSARGDAVFEKGLAIAKAFQSQLLLLHVLSSEEENSPMPIPPNAEQIYWAPGTELDIQTWQQQWQRYESECLEQLQKRAAQANTAGIQTEFQQILGSPGKLICQTAKQWSANLIIIGNRGRSGLSEFFLGSVSNYVLHHAPCSVLVVKFSEGQ